jgi:hypothetical protein
LKESVPEILGATRRLLERVRSGELAQPPAEELVSARVGWL